MVNVLTTKTKEITPDGPPGDTDIPTNQSKLAEIHVAEAKHGKTCVSKLISSRQFFFFIY